ncbi:MAG: hypothetical protein HY823_06515 [Acidobacteria bacterium]|nr:hypothetical protein [Acidobacteriota bacterium]
MPRTLLLALALLLPLEAQDPFASASLRALRARAGLGTFRVLQLGDSHTAARSHAATWKAHLQAQFGDGGWGYGLPWTSALAPRCGKSPGWKLSVPTLRNGTDGLGGLGGAYLEASRAGEKAWVETPFKRLRIHLLRRPGGGSVRILVDGRERGSHLLDGPVEALCVEPDLGAEGRRLEIECLGGPVRILGVALENGPGATYSALGINGAQGSWLLRGDPLLFEAVLRKEAPDLLVLAFGTNEASLGDFEPEFFRRGLKQVLDRLRGAAPGCALLLLGPPDAVLGRGRPGALAAVSRIQGEAARAAGALFVSQQEAMGGEASSLAWHREGLMARDRVHFTPEGYARLARASLGALFGRLGRARPAEAEDPRLARALPGAFELPAEAPRLLGRFEGSVSEVAPAPRPIYTFRTEEGRLIITDDPAKVEGLRGAWVGRGPR